MRQDKIAGQDLEACAGTHELDVMSVGGGGVKMSEYCITSVVTGTSEPGDVHGLYNTGVVLIRHGHLCASSPPRLPFSLIIHFFPNISSPLSSLYSY